MSLMNVSNDITIKQYCCVFDSIKKHIDENRIHDEIISCFSSIRESNDNNTEDQLSIVLSDLYGYSKLLPFNATLCATVHPCGKPPSVFFMIYMIFWSLIPTVAICGNVLVVVTICRSVKLQKVKTNYLIASLAVSDLLVALFITPIKMLSAYRNNLFCFSRHVCQFYMSVDIFFFVASITNLFAISLDRYVALIYPYAYPLVVTTRRVKYCIAFIWCYACVWSVIGNIEWHSHSNIVLESNQCVSLNYWYNVVTFAFVFYIPVIIMGFLYFKIYKVASKHAKSISKTNNMFKNRDETRKCQNARRGLMLNYSMDLLSKNSARKEEKTISSRFRALSQSTTNHIASHKFMFKITKTVFIVYGLFLLSWLPVSIMTAAFKKSVDDKWPHILFVEILPFLNSTVNPFIYGFTNKVYRHAFRMVANDARVFISRTFESLCFCLCLRRKKKSRE